VHLEGIKHAATRDNDLLRLLLNLQRPDESGNFFGRFPLGELAETLLTRPPLV